MKVVTSFDCENRLLHNGVLEPTVAVYENHGKDSQIKGPLEKSPTITAQAGTGGNNLPLVYQNVIGNLNADDYKGINNQYVTQGKCIVQKAVSRLTPTECERLQGLPDNYTLISDKTCSDTARYKALGNGHGAALRRLGYKKNCGGDGMKLEKDINRKNAQELSRLMFENPQMPVIAWINSEGIDDECAYWGGNLDKVSVETIAYSEVNEHYIYKEGDAYDDCCAYYGNEADDWTDEELDKAAKQIPWEDVIAVYVSSY